MNASRIVLCSLGVVPAVLLIGCAATRQDPASDAPAPTAAVSAPDAAAVTPVVPDDDLRLPEEEFLKMPGEGEFRIAGGASPNASPNGGAVIVRPPTDPPSRPKPAEVPAAEEP